MRAITLLVLSNVFMTTAWYLHLRPEYRRLSLWVVIVASRGIAFFEYCLQVPNNRIGYEQGSRRGSSRSCRKSSRRLIADSTHCGFRSIHFPPLP